MEGNSLTKLGRVVAHLAAHPRDFGPYLRLGPLSSRSPLEQGLPWFSLSAIRFLDSFVSRSMQVFEYGSGGSTFYFANRAAAVTSTEDDPAWLERVRTRLTDAGLTNFTLQPHPFNFSHAEDFSQSSYLQSIPDRAFDIIVVDGMEGGEQVRPACFHHAESRIAPGSIIVVDDSWRYPQLRSANRAKSYREFRGVGPCRPGVTSTDVYFY